MYYSSAVTKKEKALWKINDLLKALGRTLEVLRPASTCPVFGRMMGEASFKDSILEQSTFQAARESMKSWSP